jgi:CDP-diacylglycerol--serine O-phosphatidyltransferase
LNEDITKRLSIADYFSLINAILGFFAIISLISSFIPDELKIRISLTFLLLALLADGLDGIIARKTRRSEVGEHLDSMADMTSMGIAASIFIYLSYYSSISSSIYSHAYLFIALIFYISAATIRLSSFYKMKKENYFIGLPVPASSIILLMFAYIQVNFIVILPVIVILSATMICNITFPKPGKKLDIIAAILIILVLILGSYNNFIFPIILLIAMILYAIGGPIVIRFFDHNKIKTFLNK